MSMRKGLRRYLGISPEDSFSTYLDKIEQREHVQWMPQHMFLFDDEGNLLVQEILRLEDISRDMRDLSSRIGLDVESPLSNTTHHVKSPVVTEEDRSRVRRMYARDYELLGY